MKILTGALRGQPIRHTPNPHLRPTADKVRKALMDMLAQRLEGARVLELFAGTGALGIEALSGGAESAVFVEKDKAQCKKIEDNIRRLALAERARVIPLEASAAIAELDRARAVYDIVFMDPPYEGSVGQDTLRQLAGSSLVHEGSLLVWECGARQKAPENAGLFVLKIKRAYGDSQICVYATTAERRTEHEK